MSPGSAPVLPTNWSYSWLTSGAPRSGITIAFMNRVQTMPTMMPPAMDCTQLCGRASPRSRHAVLVHHAHRITSGAATRVPYRKMEAMTTAMVMMMPMGPSGRSAFEKRRGSREGV
jgi:hypothetical protein